MELRNHPVMVCDGVKMWPPKWIQSYGPGAVHAVGEIGTLEAVFLSKVVTHKIRLLMHTGEGNTYLGTLGFEDPDSAKAIFYFLHGCVGKALTAIGALDLPETFGNGPARSRTKIAYRRNNGLIGSEWHFHNQCEQWPDNDYIETNFLDPNKGDASVLIAPASASRTESHYNRPKETHDLTLGSERYFGREHQALSMRASGKFRLFCAIRGTVSAWLGHIGLRS